MTDDINSTVCKFNDILKENNFITQLPDKGRYNFNNKFVPRVTEILESTINEPYIAEWANWLGFKHKSYKTVLGEAAYTGTKTHSYIENLIKNGKKDLPDDANAITCINAFNRWWNQLISNNKVEVIGQEEKLVSQWFGGTYDMLLKINDKIFLIDFKTSSKVSFRYFLQLAAYRYMIEPSYNLKINGCMILRMDKKSGIFEETIVDIDTPYGSKFMDDCLLSFFSCVSAYYFRKRMELYDINKFIYNNYSYSEQE